MLMTTIIHGEVSADVRGSLEHFADFDPTPFSRMYVVRAHSAGIVRGWHLSRTQTKAFFAFGGESSLASFSLISPSHPPKSPRIERIVLDENKPVIIVVPPNTVHAIVSKTANTAVMVLASLPIEQAIEDEVRFPADQWEP